MFAASKTDSVSGAAPDGQFNYVTMLLHGDGTNGAQNNTFLDSSTNNFTITRNGNVTQGSFSPYGSNWSNFFDGNGDYLTCSASVPATGAFTVEMFLYPTSTAGYQLLFSQFTSGNAGSLQLLWDDTTDKFTVNIGLGTVLTSTSTYALNTWHHLAITRDGSNNMTMWVNGASAATTTNSTSILQTTTYIASRSALDGYFNGYISNLRVTNTAVYTTAFTPSTTPLTAISGTTLLTCADNRFIDDSASPKTLTVNGNTSVQRFNPFGTSTAYSTSVISGSGYFDGSGDYLEIANNTALDVGTGAFTLEGWMYRTSASLSDWRMFGPTANSGGFFGGRADKLGLGRSNIAWDLESSTNVYNNNAWTHVVYVRNGSGNLSIFSNGTRVATTTNSTNYGLNAGNLQIGAEKNSELFGGFFSNTRLVKGTAVYDPTQTTLTVPTAPLTAVSGTGYLGFFTNGAIFDNAMMNDLETVGNAQISTSVVKYGTGSLAFDGTGDWLVAPSNAMFNMGTGNFTIECWAYPQTQVQTYPALFNLTGTADLSVAYNHGDGTANSFSMLTGGTRTSASVTSSVNAWYHIALVRNGTTVTLYIDGTSRATTTNSSTLGGTTCTIGVYGTAFGTTAFKGYIDDLRITKGYARYTSNFTAPTSAFSDTGPY
jgi:hypothetical protein